MVCHDRLAPIAADIESLELKVETRGEEDTLDWRLFVKDDSGKITSLWHDVPLFTSDDPPRLNFVCEIPKFSRQVEREAHARIPECTNYSAMLICVLQWSTVDDQ